jgi:hypothetical protein
LKVDIALGSLEVLRRSRYPFTTISYLGLSFFTFVYTAHAWSLVFSSNTFDGNQSGDWLVNYSGGFIRRGLFGEILESFVPPDISIVQVLGIIQVILLATLYALFGLLFLRSSRSPAWLMVCLSPAVLMFSAINPEAAFRKELLPLIALGLLATGAKNGIRAWQIAPSLVIYSVALFSHEASIVLLPGMLFLVYKYQVAPSPLKFRVVSIYLIVISVIAGTSSILFPGNSKQVEAICESWNQRGINACFEGSLSTMTISTTESIDFLFSNYYPQYFLYLLILLLALVPLFLVRFFPDQWLIGLAVALFLLPLFAIAWDYGRWIYIGVSQLSLITLSMESRRELKAPIRIPLVLAVGYVVLWGFAWYDQPWRNGLLAQLLQQLGITT